MKKSQLYQGSFAPTILELTNGLSLQIWTIVPAVNFDPVATNGYAWFVGKGPPDWNNTNNPGGPLCYRKLQWQGANAVWADTNWTVRSVVDGEWQWGHADGVFRVKREQLHQCVL